MKRIRLGDTVIVIAGKSLGHVGQVVRVIGESIIIEGANLIKKCIKPNPQKNEKGGIITREAPINISNVAMYDPVNKKAAKVGFKYIEKNGMKHKVRYFKSTNELIDLI